MRFPGLVLLAAILAPAAPFAAIPGASADTLGPDGGAPPILRTQAAEAAPPWIAARVVALGIPGAGAVAAVGRFHAGGPIRDNPAFAAEAAPGRILDPARVLVASDASNFGAPPARAGDAAGAILSLDTGGAAAAPLAIPGDFASAGGQAAALDGRVRLFAAQSPAFLNGRATPGAATADLPAVAGPLGISINHGFGRLWFANAPAGLAGPGTLSIADPNGAPLANAPSRRSGGVFAADLTPRAPRQALPGTLRTGAVATAFLGPSPDGSRRAVFAVLTADGALAQAHTERDLDGLSPAGTVSPLAPADPGAPRRAGLVFNWVPDRTLFATDAARDAIVAIDLADDGEVFRPAGRRVIAVPALREPVDLAPAVPEAASPAFSSNTTLAAGSDLYVANRGDGTVVRLRQDGRVVAVRMVAVEGRPLGPGLLNGIGVSADAARLWLTVDGALPGHPDAPGALLEIAAFGPGSAAAPRPGRAIGQAVLDPLAAHGERLFAAEFAPEDGLGPYFNARSCLACHREPEAGGVGPGGLAVVHRVGRGGGDRYRALPDALGGPVARLRSLAEFGRPCGPAGIPAGADIVSARNATPLFGLGLVAAIPDAVLEGLAAAGDPAIAGRAHRVEDAADGRTRIGRFGWKADTASLETFVAEALRNELGVTGPLAPADPGTLLSPGCAAAAEGRPEDADGAAARAIAAYLAGLPPPGSGAPPDPSGAAAFARAGCAGCHVPALRTEDGRPVPLYSDLLLHDMGPLLDDGVAQGAARGRDWRTAPLWGLADRARLLHDGRAATPEAAILAHGGQGAAAADAFRRMGERDRAALLGFLSRL